MDPIAYVDYLNNRYRSKGFPAYRWSTFDSSPWTSFEKPLDQSCIALISAGGIFMEGQQPFDPWALNDLSFRQIPKDTPFERLKLHHNYFDHRDAVKDPNCVFPIQRLLEMEESGYIGQVAPFAITLGMGRLYKRTALQTETVPKILEVLTDQGADAAVLVAAWPLDHQSVGLIARGVEEGGIPTVYIGSCRDMMKLVKPPRAVFVNFPLGHQCGKPYDVSLQRSIIKDALKTLITADTPGEIVDLPYEWGEPFDAETNERNREEMMEEEGITPQEWAVK